MSLKRMTGFVLLAACALFAARSVAADQYSESLYSGLKYRNIGPFRGGRVLAVAGVPGTSTFYFGAVSGGVWKTTNAGMSWTPLTDKEDISSVGSVAVANSNPNILYVGTGAFSIACAGANFPRRSPSVQKRRGTTCRNRISSTTLPATSPCTPSGPSPTPWCVSETAPTPPWR